MGRFFPVLPITQKLLPTSKENWLYLLEVAALTRLVTGGIRVWVERPSQQNDPGASNNEKRQSMVERFFVEILGTLGYMAVLHLGQDFIDSIHASRYKHLPNIQLRQLPLASQKQLEKITGQLGWTIDILDAKINQMILDVYQHPQSSADHKAETQHLLYRVLYGDDMTYTIHGQTRKRYAKANLATMKARFIEEFDHLPDFQYRRNEFESAFDAIVHEVRPLKAFAIHNNRWASAAIALGVSLSALIGGNVIQMGNDWIVAPLSKSVLNKLYPYDQRKPTASLDVTSVNSDSNLSLRSPPPGIAYIPNPKTQPNSGYIGSVPPFSPYQGMQTVFGNSGKVQS